MTNRLVILEVRELVSARPDKVIRIPLCSSGWSFEPWRCCPDLSGKTGLRARVDLIGGKR